MKKRGWVKKFEPCRAILLEDLARYRFRVDRPKSENSQLMQWNHRQIFDEVVMQAGLYGISAITTGAGFTSRFHSRTGAPGLRVRTITAADLSQAWFQKPLQEVADVWGVSIDFFKPGMQIPFRGGEEFVSLESSGKTVVLDADINAAQNLQRRFWTRHGDAYRIVATEIAVDGDSYWYPASLSKRIRGALMGLVSGPGYARLVPVKGNDSSFELESIKKRDYERATGTKGDSTDAEEAGAADPNDQLLSELIERTTHRTKAGCRYSVLLICSLCSALRW